MDAERWRRVETLLAAALATPPDERDAVLAFAASEDPELAHDARRLLEADAEAGDFLELAVADGAAALHREREAATPGHAAGDRVGPYQLIRELGRGGMGTVYLARRAEPDLPQEVALKLIHGGLDHRDMVQRFHTERSILARLQHRHIARLYDAGQAADGRPWFAMEYVVGEPIDESCDRRQASVAERLQLFLQVAAAVLYAHQNLVVHRDLKPSNVLVTAAGEPKLLDFGIAKLLEPRSGEEGTALTALTARPMTLAYASPEQVRGQAVSTASDVYSLGVLLYQLLTGRRPYDLTGRTPREIEDLVCDRDPERPSAVVRKSEGLPAGVDAEQLARRRGLSAAGLARRLAGDLDTVVTTALAKEPERRYRSVDHLAEDVRRYLDGVPISVRRAGWAYRTSKFLRRHRLGAAFTAAAVVALLAFGAYRWQVSARMSAERDRLQDVAAIMVELFGVPDPQADNGDTVTARELLDRGVARVTDTFPADPETRALLLATLGNLYARLHLYDHAEPLIRRSLAVPNVPARSEQTALAWDDLGRVLAAKGDFTAALEAFERAYTLLSALRGDDHPRALDLLNNLGLGHHDLGHYETAERLYRRGLALLERRGESASARAMPFLLDLALLHSDRGELPQAESLQRQAVAIARRVDPAGGSLAFQLTYLTEVLWARGRFAEAEEAAREALAISERVNGRDHRDTGRLLHDLGALRRDRGDRAAAATLFREALDIRQRKLGVGHAETAATHEELAELALTEGDPATALNQLNTALGIYQTSFGDSYPLTDRTHAALGRAHAQAGNCTQALGHLTKALATLPAPDWRAVAAQAELARCQLPTGDPTARQRLTLARERLAQRFGPEDPRVRRLAP